MAETLDLAQVLELLAENERRAQRVLNMVPSENALAGIAKLPLLLDVHHRYFFNEGLTGDRWHFRGAQDVAELETRLVLPLLRELTGARHVSARPLSGLSAMTVVLAALAGPPGSTVVTVPLELGGHYATPQIASRMGLAVEFLPALDPHTVDLEGTAALVRRLRPPLVYVDQSNCLFPLAVRPLVEAVRAGSPGTLVHVDSSHWLGLVFGKALPSPLAAGADSFGGSTHKTFPGPQKAILATDRDDLDAALRGSLDFLVSNHHLGAALCLGIALLQFREFGAEYAARIVAGTRQMGARLHELGLPVSAAQRGYSAGHQLWLDTEAAGVPAREASERLFGAGIRTNFLPDLPGFGARQVLRVGLNEPVYRGFGSAALDRLGELFARAVTAPAEALALAAGVEELRRSSSPLAATAGPVLDAALRLCATALHEGEPDRLRDAPVAAAALGGPR